MISSLDVISPQDMRVLLEITYGINLVLYKSINLSVKSISLFYPVYSFTIHKYYMVMLTVLQSGSLTYIITNQITMLSSIVVISQ